MVDGIVQTRLTVLDVNFVDNFVDNFRTQALPNHKETADTANMTTNKRQTNAWTPSCPGPKRAWCGTSGEHT